MVAIKAHFDGKVFVPDEPVILSQGQRLILHVEAATDAAKLNGDAWAVLDELTGSVEAPADWAEQHDHYLYGTPKRPTK